MSRMTLTIILFVGFLGCGKSIDYPKTRRVDHVDDYFGTKIPDPYRWLENDTAADVKAWVDAQNRVTFGYLEQIPYRAALKNRLEEIWNYPKYSAPFKKGNTYFYYKNDGLQNQSVLYYQTSLQGESQVFLDPNQLSSDGTVALQGISFSKDHKYAAYSVSESGSDWTRIHVMEVATKRVLDDQIRWVKFGGAAWSGNGFYYSRYDEPKAGSALAGKNEFQKVYYHKLGTPQSQDERIYEDPNHPLRYFWASVSEDGRYLFLHSSEGTHGTEVHIRDLQAKQSSFRLLLKGFEHNYSVLDHVDGKIYVLTDDGASRYQLVAVDPVQSEKASWTAVIPEQDVLLEDVSIVGEKLFAKYLRDASTEVVQYDLSGKKERVVELPSLGTASGFGGSRTDMETFYTFVSFTSPPTIYRYDLRSGSSELFRKSEVSIDLDGYETKQVFYPSKDGTRIPLFIVHKKGLPMDGSHPTYLYAYGGFNVSLTPGFSPSRMLMLEKGVVFAMPNLRGGGEYGEEWHKAGMLEKKQNVFDDFISAGEFLVSSGYTSPSKLAVAGGSNGGLLVGAVLNQRPDLFGVAFPAVGVMDMLRYHKFTIGWGWAVEYGSSDKKEQFEYLIRYSPLHNIKSGTRYPAVLVTTADHDDRVVPAHSFKYIATLQEHQSGSHPTLIRIGTKAGHGAGKPTSKQIEEATDAIAFMFHNMGYAELPQ